MKGYGRLLKGFVWGIVSMVILALFFLLLFIINGLFQSPSSMLWVISMYLFFLAAALLVFVVYAVIVWAAYRKEKEKLYGIPGFSEERFLREIDRAPQIKNVLLCSDAVCFVAAGYFVRTIPIREIVWVYQEPVQAVMYLQIYTRDRERYSVPVQVKKKVGTADMACRYIMRLIARKNKGALIGYQENYEAMLKNDFRSLLMMAQAGEIADSGLLEQEYIQNDYYVRDLQ